MTASLVAAWAEDYASVGWRVFPADGKRPAFAGWQQAATTDPATLRRWWPSDERPANLAAVTGELFDVFDVEREHLRALATWVIANDHVLPVTPVAYSGGGGLHIYVKPLGIRGTRLRLDGVHIGELKAHGGLVILPPSITAGQYTWRLAPSGLTLAEAPEWLRSLIVPRRQYLAEPRFRRVAFGDEQRRALRALADALPADGSHMRNDMLFWAACRALEEGVDPGIAANLLRERARERGLDDREIERTLASAVGTVLG